MTTVTDLVHDVVGYLVTQCQQNPALGQANPPVVVVDGPNPPGEEVQVSGQALWIGYDASVGDKTVGTATQTFAYVGNSAGRRREDGAIICTAQAWSGDPKPAAARLLCKGLVGAVEAMLRGYPAINGPGDSSMGGLVQWSQTDSFSWSQESSGGGYSAMCVFRVSYVAYLNP